MKVGKAKYGGGKKTYFKLKDGDSVFRILPPLGDLADDGVWSLYYAINYGYKNAAGKSRPFVSSLVKNRDNGMVEVPDAAVERLEMLKSELEKVKAAKNKAGVETMLKLVGAPKSLYNLDKNHYLNAIDSQGNIGILKLRHRAKQALDTAIRKLRDKGIDPLSQDNGRYFTFTRTGTGNETQFQIVPATRAEKDPNGGDDIERPIKHVLTDEILQRLSSEAGELNKLFKKPTADQIAQIVAESDIKTGISPNVDEILGYKSDAEAASAQGDAEAENEEYIMQSESGSVSTSTTEVTNVTAADVTPPPAKVSPIVETQPEPKKAAPVNNPTTTAEKVADMSNEAFLKSLGLE